MEAGDRVSLVQLVGSVNKWLYLDIAHSSNSSNGKEL